MIRPISPTRPPGDPDTRPRPAFAPGPPSEAQPRRGRRGSRRAPKPVFVDRSGRRRRVVVVSGSAFAVLVLLALAMLIAGLFGASPVPLPGLPDLVGPATTQPPPEPTEPTQPGPTQPEPTPTGATTAPGPVLPTNANATSPPRHIPTQTPTDPGRPTKT